MSAISRKNLEKLEKNGKNGPFFFPSKKTRAHFLILDAKPLNFCKSSLSGQMVCDYWKI